VDSIHHPAGNPVAEEVDNNHPAPLQMSCRISGRMGCLELLVIRSWDSPQPAARRRRYRTSGRGHCWLRTSDTLSIVAYSFSVTSPCFLNG
jgi:hypothetical protein